MKPRRYTKETLPQKVCRACGRPFAWRKKWARDWADVKYCSDRCGRRPPPAVDGRARRG